MRDEDIPTEWASPTAKRLFWAVMLLLAVSLVLDAKYRETMILGGYDGVEDLLLAPAAGVALIAAMVMFRNLQLPAWRRGVIAAGTGIMCFSSIFFGGFSASALVFAGRAFGDGEAPKFVTALPIDKARQFRDRNRQLRYQVDLLGTFESVTVSEKVWRRLTARYQFDLDGKTLQTDHQLCFRALVQQSQQGLKIYARMNELVADNAIIDCPGPVGAPLPVLPH